MGKKKKKNKPKQRVDVEDAAASSDEDIPEGFLCPITQTLLRDPVIIVRCGHTFERHDIANWCLSLSSSHNTHAPTQTHPQHPSPLYWPRVLKVGGEQHVPVL